MSETFTNRRVDVRSLSEQEIKGFRVSRWRSRTDLEFLCKVLGYKHVERAVHGSLIDVLQKFPRPSEKEFVENDRFERGQWLYTPLRHMLDLEGLRKTLILDARGHLKCLCPEQLVGLASGEYRPASNLCIGDCIRGFDEKLCTPKYDTIITGIKRQPAQQCFEVVFKSGRRLSVSHNHPFRTMTAWVEAQTLRPGDRVPVVGLTPEPENAPFLPWAAILGWFLGDGSFSCQVITNENPAFRAQIIAAAEQAGGTAWETFPKERTAGVRVQGLRPLFEQQGLLDAHAGTKFIPRDVFLADNASVAACLYGLFMSDATANKDGIFLLTKSKQMAHDAQRLLLRFDIFANVKAHHTTYRGERRVYWRVGIQSVPQVKRFIDRIGWTKHFVFDLSAKSNPNINTIPKAWRSLYPKYLWERGNRPKELGRPRSLAKYDISKTRLQPVAEALQDPFLLNLCKDDLYWDTVETVTPLGPRETIAIETSDGTICVDDVVTHNTTVNCEAHTIQWILNYPDIAILLIQSTGDKASDYVKKIKAHFQGNERFRALFPELCPQKGVNNWGTQSEFEVANKYEHCNRLNILPPKEPTVRGIGVESGSSGSHYHVLKFSDIVEEKNAKDPDMCRAITRSFHQMENLLISQAYWIDVEGTRYHNADCYGKIIREEWEAIPDPGAREYKFYVRSCFKRARPDGKPQQFTPDELNHPFQIDQHGKRIPFWPKDNEGHDRFPLAKLEKMELRDGFLFSCQQLNSPSATGMIIFPVNDSFPVKCTRKVFKSNIRIAYYTIAVDTAESNAETANFSALSVIGWSASGKAYVVELQFGRWLPDELIKRMVALAEKYGRWLQSFKLEKVSFNRGLMTGLMRAIRTFPKPGGLWVPLELIPVPTRKDKAQKIQETLQPWYSAGDIVFLEDLVARERFDTDKTWAEKNDRTWKTLLDELRDFPMADSDDLLDSISLHFANKQHFGRLKPRLNEEQFAKLHEQKYLGIHDPFDPYWRELDGGTSVDEFYSETGGL